MGKGESKIDTELMKELDKLKDEEEIDVLLFPKQMGGEIEEFLLSKKKEGLLDYNILKIANCIVIKATKKVILKIATRDEVSRITVNPRFTI